MNERIGKWRELSARFRTKLLIFDPGFVNSRSALRGTLSVVISFFVLSYMTKLVHQPMTLAFIGIQIAMMSSIIVNDPTPRQQKLSMLLLPIPAIVAASASIALAGHPRLRLTGFLVTSFVAVSMRRLGLRWIGLGMAGFFAYFAPLFFPIRIESILWVALGILVATAVAFAIRFWLLPENPQYLLQLYVEAFQNRCRAFLRTGAFGFKRAADASARGHGEPSVLAQRALNRMQQTLVPLNELTIIVEQFLRTTDSHALRSASEELQMALFEQELALRQRLDCLRALRLEELKAEDYARISGDLTGTLQLVRPIGLEAMINTVTREMETEGPRTQKTAQVPQKEGLHISTRQAIQATLATAIASVIGASVSAERWYWASAAAFLIFVGTTRGETMTRAFVRVLGTIAGLITGFLIAYGLSGHQSIEWALIVSSVFFAIFGFRYAFGFWSASFFTLMIAILYDLLGKLNHDFLVLRLEETLVGAAIGAIVGAFVLPTSTHVMIRGALSKLLRTVSVILEEISPGSSRPLSRRALVQKLRELDRDLLALRAAAAPIVGRTSLMRKGDLPLMLHDASALSHFLRHLVVYKEPMDDACRELVQASCDRLIRETRRLANQLETKSPDSHRSSLGRQTSASTASSSTDASMTSPDFAQTRSQEVPLHWFERIEQVLSSLEQRKI